MRTLLCFTVDIKVSLFVRKCFTLNIYLFKQLNSGEVTGEDSGLWAVCVIFNVDGLLSSMMNGSNVIQYTLF
jgi:hypothetical protein